MGIGQMSKKMHPGGASSSGHVCGPDRLGIARFATLSDGTFIAPLNSLKKHQQRLAGYQPAMSRKVKGSKNRHKAKRRAQRVYSRIAHCRNDFLNKDLPKLRPDRH